MGPRKRLLLLISIMATVVLIVDLATISLLYQAALGEERARLREIAQSQARLIESVARFDDQHGAQYPLGARQATLTKLTEAHRNYAGFGATGEFTLAWRDGDAIVFVLNHRHSDLSQPQPVPWDSDLSEPMRLALSGLSGTIIGRDYRGAQVVAAFEPVAVLDLGIVAKIDLAEVQAPFVEAGLLSGLVALLLVAIGAGVFLRVTNPLIRQLEATVADRERALREVKTLRGILPICSFCKKIRDDAGYWDQVEVYVRQHTEADFSHGVCPECLETHYGELFR